MIEIIINFLKYILAVPNAILNWFVFNYTSCTISPDWQIKGRIYVKNYGTLTIGKKFKANSGKNKNPIGGETLLRLVCNKQGKLLIGDQVGISNSTIVCWNRIEIGNYVYIGGGCKIWDTDFHSLDPIERRHNGDKKVNTAPIFIQDYAFIGAGSIILKGVTIGKNSIIGAGSVVTKSVPNNEIWAGNPARFIKKIVSKNR